MGFIKKLGKRIGKVAKTVSPFIAKLGIPVVSQVAGGVNLVTGLKEKADAVKANAQRSVFEKTNLRQVADANLSPAQKSVFSSPTQNNASAASIIIGPVTVDDDKKWYQKTGGIVGIVVGALLLIALVVGLFTKKRR